ncbi:restriction endonuclease subunit S [Streptosporangium sandarakinum]
MRTERPSWLPALPEGWSLVRGRIVARLVQRPPSAGEGVVTAFRDGQVTLRSNRRIDGFTEAVQEIGYQGVRAGELVIHSMDGFAGAMGVSDSDGKMSPVVHIYSVPDDNPYYIAHTLRIAARSGFIQSLAKGIRERSTSFDKPTFKDILLPRPPRAEQDAIVTYLDHETARIDTLIEEQQRLIEMLRERRRSAVLHLIPPLAGLGSGVDKLGRTTRIGNGSTPRRENIAYWDGGNIPWLNSSVVNEPRVGSAAQFVTESALAECHLPLVSPGSVLVGLTGQGKTRGMATILDIQATVSQHVAYVTPDRSKWWPEYLLWAFTAAYNDLRKLSEENGSTKGGLTCEALKQLRMTVPSLEEQRYIAARLNEQTAKIDTLITETERFIELARERWAALITAAVTGQIDVREAA